MHTPKPYGFVLRTSDDSPVFLPLKSVSVHATIIDISAQVELTQVYANADALQNTGARYLFPVPANAAVCAFRMETADGRVVHAVVKEKEAAKQEYESAVKRGKWAGLLEQVTGDVFVVSVGAIPRGQDITVNINYVLELPQDDLVNQVRFTLPTYIAERYGNTPAALSAPTSSDLAALQLGVSVQMASSIQKIASPSHNIESTDPELVQPVLGQAPVYKSNVKLAPSSQYASLTKDFILTIQAANLHKPRCLASVSSSRNSVAMSLTLVPQFGIPPIAEQEYIFVIDRSGSMAGTCIQVAKDALTILLKSLPGKGSSFNIASFGSHFEMMWTESRPYGKESLKEAVDYVQNMDANMGGTEINSVLNRVYETRSQTIPTSVFVLTDGEVWNTKDIFNTTRTAVTLAGPASQEQSRYLRVFTLGIGYGASTELCEGLARTGNGLCYMVADSADIPSRCSYLLKAAKVPPVASLWGMAVDWGRKEVDESVGRGGEDKRLGAENDAREEESARINPKTFSFFDESLGTPEDIAKRDADAAAKSLFNLDPTQSPLVKQAPASVPDIYPFNRFIVSAILLDTTHVPDNVTLSGKLPGTNEDVKMTFQVQRVDEEISLLHTLAARRLITDLQDRICTTPGWTPSFGSSKRDTSVKEEIVRLSEEYQLASEYAAFVAVEEARVEGVGEGGKEKAKVGAEEDDDWLEVELVQAVKEITLSESRSKAFAPDMSRMRLQSRAAPHAMAPPPPGSALQPQSTGHLRFAPPPPSKGKTMAFSMPPRPIAPRAPPSPVQFSIARASLSMGGSGGGRSFGGGGAPMGALRASSAVSFDSLEGLESADEDDEDDMGFALHDDEASGADPAMMRSSVVSPRAAPMGRRQALPKSAPALNSRSEQPKSAMHLAPITIALLQDHSGSFSLTEDVVELLAANRRERGETGEGPTLERLKSRIPAALRGCADREEVWATLLVAALMMNGMASTRDTWIGMWEKAKEYVVERIEDEDLFMALLEEAEKCL